MSKPITKTMPESCWWETAVVTDELPISGRRVPWDEVHAISRAREIHISKNLFDALTDFDDVARKIVAMLDEKKALRENLPMHLDRDKFLFLLRKDIRGVLEE